MLMSMSRIARTRSTPTAAWAMAPLIFATSCTGLKNFARYERKTVSDPIVIAEADTSEAPRQRTKPVQRDTITVTTGDRSDFTRLACSAAWTAC
jgi:hypothetical protein